VFPVKYGQTYRVEQSFNLKTGRWIMSRIVIGILTYHRHKHTIPKVLNHKNIGIADSNFFERVNLGPLPFFYTLSYYFVGPQHSLCFVHCFKCIVQNCTVNNEREVRSLWNFQFRFTDWLKSGPARYFNCAVRIATCRAFLTCLIKLPFLLYAYKRRSELFLLQLFVVLSLSVLIHS
jgi:hypothetical protein